MLKINNVKTNDIHCNSDTLSLKQLDENYEHIMGLNETHVNNGYLCSTFDPLFFLLSELFEINIHHLYNGIMVKYINKVKSRKIYEFGSNSSHFWFIKLSRE
jgi:hypothetical protein